MSNSIAPGSSADVNVRVTALTTNPNVPVTYKTIILKKNLVNGVNTLTQEMMSAANTKYVVKYDYTLGEDIIIPANCVLEFDGGKIILGNYTISGGVRNDFLNVADFSATNDITDACNKLLVISNIYIPIGEWLITSEVSVPTERQITGYGTGLAGVNGAMGSIVCIDDANSFFSFSECESTRINNIAFRISGGNGYAIKINGIRHCVFENLFIYSLYTSDESRNQGNGIQIKNTLTGFYRGVTLSRFSNIEIKDVCIGIDIDTTTSDNNYVTSCTFENINIYNIYNTGIKLNGKSIYTNIFNNITIQDSYKGTIDHKGISFNGTSGNRFNNLIMWADAKGGTNDWYSLWFDGDTGYVASPSYMDGDIEGQFGGVQGWEGFLNRIRYKLTVGLFSSKTGESEYVGQISNWDPSVYRNVITNVFNWIDAIKKTHNILGTGNLVTNLGKIVVEKTSGNDIGVEFSLDTTIPNYLRVFYLAKATGGYLDIRITSSGSTVFYETADNPAYDINVQNTSLWHNTTQYNSFWFAIKGINASKLELGGIYIIKYASDTNIVPAWVFMDNKALLESLVIEDFNH